MRFVMAVMLLGCCMEGPPGAHVSKASLWRACPHSTELSRPGAEQFQGRGPIEGRWQQRGRHPLATRRVFFACGTVIWLGAENPVSGAQYGAR